MADKPPMIETEQFVRWSNRKKTPYIWLGKPWFPVDFPFNRSSEHSTNAPLRHRHWRPKTWRVPWFWPWRSTTTPCSGKSMRRRQKSGVDRYVICDIITVDDCEFLRHQNDGWSPINNGMFTTYQLLRDFFHPPYVIEMLWGWHWSNCLVILSWLVCDIFWLE